MKFSQILMAICFSIGITATANAAIVSTTGSVSYTTAPSSVAVGGSENSTSIIAFDEQQDLSLSSALSVDYLTSTGTTGTLATGTQLNSYLIHFDPVGTSVLLEDLVTLTGSITFSNRITGLIYSGVPCDNCPATPEYLDASDHLGATGTLYPTGELGRGLELDSDPYYTGRGDFFSLSADGRTLDLSFTAYPLRMDQLRVVTFFRKKIHR